jgi:hypothetical protein
MSGYDTNRAAARLIAARKAVSNPTSGQIPTERILLSFANVLEYVVSRGSYPFFFPKLAMLAANTAAKCMIKGLLEGF